MAVVAMAPTLGAPRFRRTQVRSCASAVQTQSCSYRPACEFRSRAVPAAIARIPTPLSAIASATMPAIKAFPEVVAPLASTVPRLLKVASLRRPVTEVASARAAPASRAHHHEASVRSRSTRARGSAAREPMPVTFQAGPPGTPSRRILCYGDSLTVGFFDGGRQYEPYGRQLAASLSEAIGGAGVEVVVCGQSGHTAADMVSNLDAALVEDVGKRVSKGLRRVLSDQRRPVDLAVIMAGTNDLGHDFGVQGIFEDVGRLHRACHALGVPTLALAPPPAPRAGSGSAFERGREQLTRLLTNWAVGIQGVLALVKPGELVPAGEKRAWDPDGLHFAPEGSRLLGQRLSQVIAVELRKRRP